MSRRQLIPWRAAGTRSQTSGHVDDVVRDTGWVFNNQMGASLTLDEFVGTGDSEVEIYLDRLGWSFISPSAKLLEIGSGIGRMTSAFTHKFETVIAADVDAAFLERCRETVSRFGLTNSLSTVHIEDGHSIAVADSSVDIVFSYITLQHCRASDALGLTSEAFRVVKSGGYVALNYRTWVPADVALLPAGVMMRVLWNIPVVGEALSRWRWSTRLGWQANRIDPKRVFALLEASKVDLSEVAIMHYPNRPQKPTFFNDVLVPQHDLDVCNKSHWWLVARCR